MNIIINNDSIFNPKEVNKIIKLGDSLVHTEGLIKNDKLNHKVRNSLIAWVHPGKEALWIFYKAIEAFKGSAPFSTLQSMQYTVYHKGGHYDWHRDVGEGDEIMKARVNVGVLQLSDPSDYEGGVLEVKVKNKITQVPKQQGLVTTFPVDIQHRVTPTESGVRKTLIMWGLK